MSLSRLESETGINYNDEEDSAIVYTANNGLKKKLDGLCKLYPDEFKHIILAGDNNGIASYHIPKKFVSIRIPGVYSKENKIKQQESGHRLSARRSENMQKVLQNSR